MNQKAVTIVLTGQPTGIVHTCALTAHAWLMSMGVIRFSLENTAEPLLF